MDGLPETNYEHAEPTWANAYLWPPLKRLVASRTWPSRRAFDLGCGNGATAGMLHGLGFDVVAVDPSESGIAQAHKAFPGVRAFVGSGYDDLAATYSTFPLVVSLEVIEHCVNPRAFARTFLSLIATGGVGFLSTPYHGYLKNVALAVSGKLDAHFTVLWDGGPHQVFLYQHPQPATARSGGTQCDVPACRPDTHAGQVDDCPCRRLKFITPAIRSASPRANMAEFKAKIRAADGTEHAVWVRTCEICKGIGYLTKPLVWKSQMIHEDVVHIHRAESGDACPLCPKRGWTAIADGKWREV